ncbi:enolase 4 [Labeo rohita]|uniref:phosphopyruvate hydratase n=1 Tax=Labeo rohita TaxID=84645 RepID=A0A498N9Z9_LABRO|nr:enolase 4 [Labeo rohita]
MLFQQNEANYFSRLSYTPVISKITGKEVFDARGLTAVQTEVYCIIRNEEKVQSEMHLPLPMITILSCGKNSVGKLNLLEEVILMPSSAQRVREVIGMGLELQCEMRRVLNGSAYKAGPIGVSDEGALQVGFERPEQALDLVTDACANLELPLGSDLCLAINCAAHGLMDYSRGKYEVMSGFHKSPDELVDMYEGLINKYPAITSLIDPFRKEAVGSGVSFLKLGGLRGGERMDKYNRLMAIEEELEQEEILGAKGKKQHLSDVFETPEAAVTL